ncbi:MAG: AAA family ATPase [Microcoleaceae cyanobacterium]
MTALIVMIGLPGSGKSFLASQLVSQIYPHYCLISTDGIRVKLFGDEAIQGSWLKIWQQVHAQLQQSVLQVPGAIYDATNVQRRQRREVITCARTLGFRRIIGVWLNTPLDLCLERNQQRDRQVPEEIIFRMHRQLIGALPSLAEDFDSLVILQPTRRS